MALVKKTCFAVAGFVLFLIFSPVQWIHQFWHRCVLGQNVETSLSIPSVYADVLMTVEEALRTLFPEAQNIETHIQTLSDEQMKIIEESAGVSLNPDYERKFRFFIAKNENGSIAGYAGEDAVPGKWGPIHYMLAIDPDGRIRDVIVLEYQEKRGRPVAENRFIKQFRKKTVEDELKIMRDIRGVTGASISSNGMTNGIRKMMHIYEMFYGRK